MERDQARLLQESPDDDALPAWASSVRVAYFDGLVAGIDGLNLAHCLSVSDRDRADNPNTLTDDSDLALASATVLIHAGMLISDPREDWRALKSPERWESLDVDPVMIRLSQTLDEIEGLLWRSFAEAMLILLSKRIGAAREGRADHDRQAFAAWISQRAAFELRCGDAETSETIQRYERGDVSLLDQFITARAHDPQRAIEPHTTTKGCTSFVINCPKCNSPRSTIVGTFRRHLWMSCDDCNARFSVDNNAPA